MARPMTRQRSSAGTAMRFVISGRRTRDRRSHGTQAFTPRPENGLLRWTATIFLPDRLRRATEAIEANPHLVVVYSAFDYLNEDGTRIFFPVFPARELWPALRYRSPVLPSTATIRRSVLLAAGGFRKVFIEDWDLGSGWSGSTRPQPFTSCRRACFSIASGMATRRTTTSDTPKGCWT